MNEINENSIPQTLLCKAIHNKDIDLVKQLLGSSMDREITDVFGRTALHYAAEIGNLEIVKLLLELNSEKLNLVQFITHRDKEGKTALHFAAKSLAIEIIPYLRAKSENQLDEIKDNKGLSPLDYIRSMQTMRKSNNEKFKQQEMKILSDTIKVLVKNSKLDEEITFLLKYIEEGNLKGVEEIIKKYPELLESRNCYTNTPLFEAIYNKQFEIAYYLINLGADINKRCHEGKNSLHRAAWVKNKELVLELINRGVNVNALNDHGATPLLDAAGVDNNIEILTILLDHGANLNHCDGLERNIIHVAAVDNCYMNIEYLFAKIKDKKIFEHPDGFGRRPSHLAAERNHVDTLQILLKLGCEIDAKDHYSRTPLHQAVSSGAFNVTKYLLDNGADLEAIDKKNRTPLHLAARNGQLEIIDYLVNEWKADVLKKDIKNRTPLDVAKTHKNAYVDKRSQSHASRLTKACKFLSNSEKCSSSKTSQRFYADDRDYNSYRGQPRRQGLPPQSRFNPPEKDCWRPKRP